MFIIELALLGAIILGILALCVLLLSINQRKLSDRSISNRSKHEHASICIVIGSGKRFSKDEFVTSIIFLKKIRIRAGLYKGG